MTETELWVEVAPELVLEAQMAPADGPSGGGGVVCHPHPLYGGSMENNVVLAARDALIGRGLAAIRFNFRGVGRSRGVHGHGLAEVDDVRAVCRQARERWAAVHLVGYSFGAWVALKALGAGLEVASLTLIALPIGLLDCDDLALGDTPAHVIVGDRDPYCPLTSLEAWLEQQAAPPELDVIAGCDHFYLGHEPTLAAYLGRFLERVGA